VGEGGPGPDARSVKKQAIGEQEGRADESTRRIALERGTHSPWVSRVIEAWPARCTRIPVLSGSGSEAHWASIVVYLETVIRLVAVIPSQNIGTGMLKTRHPCRES